MATIGVPREVFPGERRVAATPESITRLQKLGFEVSVESGAGAEAGFTDEVYAEAGATVVDDPKALWAAADIVLKVRAPMERPDMPGTHEADWLKADATLVSFIWPASNDELVKRLAARKATVFAMDKVPRITRAQKMDALSSMANIAGYRAVVEAAHRYGSFFTAQMTAAGSLPPAKVLIIGAGVAGLAAIGAARGLGGIVRAFDTRAAAKDQVKSLGAEFLEVQFEESGEGGGGYAKVMSKEFIEAEMALFQEQAKEVDIVITTALIPGRPAPRLWTEDHLKAMKPGSVVVDLAAEQGGNCDATENGKIVDYQGVSVIGYSDMPSRLPRVASRLYGMNLVHFLDDLASEGSLTIDLDNEVTRGSIICQQGEVLWPPPKKEAPPAPKPAPKPAVVEAEPIDASKPAAEPEKAKSSWLSGAIGLILVALWAWARFATDGQPASLQTAQFVQHLTVFALAIFVGWQVVWNVTAALHTPLMSVTNAISGIIILGGMLQVGDTLDAAGILGLAAALIATINIAGGFLVTQRMLAMFRK